MLLNWVRTKTLLNPEFKQLLMGISTSRYFPAKGTAGFDRSFVKGNRRVPAPPPMTIARVLFWREIASIIRQGSDSEARPLCLGCKTLSRWFFFYVWNHRICRQG